MNTKEPAVFHVKHAPIDPMPLLLHFCSGLAFGLLVLVIVSAVVRL